MSNPVQGIQAPAVDAAQQPNSEQPQVATQVDPKLELYARKERQLLKQRKEFEEAKKAWELERGQYLHKNRLKEDPLSALADVDLDYQKLTDTVLNQPNINDPTIKALQAQLRKLEERDAQREKQAQEAEEKRVEQGRNQLLNDVKVAANGNADFELIEKWEAYDAVVELMESRFEDDGPVMSVAEACKAVEEKLLTEALKVYETNKIKERLNGKPKEAAQSQGQAPESAASAGKWKQAEPYSVTSSARNINTLTNRLTQETPKPASSAQDRMARAIAAMKGELK